MVLKVVIQQSTFNITYTFACVQIRHNPLSGGYCGEVPPLPIPNREVKLTCADGTAMQCGRVGSRLLSISEASITKVVGAFLLIYINYICYKVFKNLKKALIINVLLAYLDFFLYLCKR